MKHLIKFEFEIDVPEHDRAKVCGYELTAKTAAIVQLHRDKAINSDAVLSLRRSSFAEFIKHAEALAASGAEWDGKPPSVWLLPYTCAARLFTKESE